jgi:hypothetical protein
MNIWLRKKARTKLFEFDAKDIDSFKIKSVIKKNGVNRKIEGFYNEKDAYNDISKNKELKDIKSKYAMDKIRKKCIIIFQGFCAKSIDVYFLIKKEGADSYIINSIQMKCSDEYVIDEKLYDKSQYEMTYSKNIFQILFNIKICESYITYLSIFEKPKNCAIQNLDKFFFYSIELDNFVDQNNKEINNLPFYNSCFVNFVEEEHILKVIRNYIKEVFVSLKFNTQVIENVNNENLVKNNIIIVTETENEIFADIYINGLHSEIKIKEYCSTEKKNNIKKYYKIVISENV